MVHISFYILEILSPLESLITSAGQTQKLVILRAQI